MVIGTGGNQGLVGDAKHLMTPCKTVQKLGHGSADATTHAAVNLVEQQGDREIRPGKTGFQGQEETGRFTAGGHVPKWGHGFTGIGGKEEAHILAAILRGGLRLQFHSKAHLLQSHGSQHSHEISHKPISRLLPALAQLVTGLAKPIMGRPFLLLNTLLPRFPIQLRRGPRQFIPAADQLRQALAVPSLQAFKLGDALLKIRQGQGLALQLLAVVLQRQSHVLHLVPGLLKPFQERLKGGVNGNQTL